MATVRNRYSAVRFARLALVAASFAAAGGTQGAVVHCVSNSQQLQNALTNSSDGGADAGLENHIHIVQGSYSAAAKSPEGSFAYISTASTGSLVIAGGYTAGCGSRSPDPLTTLVGGAYQWPVFDIESVHGSVLVEGLTIQQGHTIASNDGGGLVLNSVARDRSASEVFNVVIRDNHSDRYSGGFFIGADGPGNEAIVHGSVIVDNTAATDSGGGEIIGNSEGVLFYDNTVVRNTSGASQNPNGGVYAAGTQCEFSNNIFYDNQDVDAEGLCDGDMSLYFNDLGSGALGEVSADVGNVSAPPRFVDQDHNDFHLTRRSPLLGASYVLLGGTDLDGNPYPSGGRQDAGAYEETVFVGDFEAGPAN